MDVGERVKIVCCNSVEFQKVLWGAQLLRPFATLPARPTVTGCWDSRRSPLALCEAKEPIRSEAKIGCSKPEKGARRPAGRAGEERGRSGEGRARRRPALSASGAPDRKGGSLGERASARRGRRGEAGARRGFAGPPRVT